MRKLLSIIFLLTTLTFGQLYPVKDTTVTAMQRLRAMTALIDGFITNSVQSLTYRVNLLEADNIINKQKISDLYDSIAAIRGTVIIEVPPKITGLDTAGGCTTTIVNLNWVDAVGELGFILERKTDGTLWAQVAIIAQNVITYSNTGLAPSTFYTYRIKGYNSAGNGIVSDTLRTKTRTPGSVPAQVANLRATDTTSTSIFLAWNNVSSETGFQIQRKLGNQAVGSFVQIGTTITDVLTFSNTGLTASTIYTYRVRAVNGIGNGTFSDTLRISTKSIPSVIVRSLLTTPAAIDQDDMAIWYHPTSPDSSVIVCSDKVAARIFVYDMAGNLLQTIVTPGLPGNIDARYQFVLSGNTVDIFAVNDRTNNNVLFYKITAVSRRTATPLSTAGSFSITGVFTYENYGLSLYRSPYNGAYYVFVSDYQGMLAQWKLYDNAGSVGAVGGTFVRRWQGRLGAVADIAEAMVCDDETGRLYVAFENFSIREYLAEPDSSTSYVSEFAIVGTDGVTADIEGIAIYYNSNGTGYIGFSNQGASNYKFYTRQRPHTFVKTVVVSGAADGDGFDMASMSFGPIFPQGIAVMHAGAGPGGLGNNIEIVQDWPSFGLNTNTTYWNPRRAAAPPASDSLFSFSTPYIFPTANINTGYTQATLTLTNNSGISLTITAMTGLSAPYSLSGFSGEQIVPNGSSFNFIVSVDRNIAANTYIDTINITAAKPQKWVVQITLINPGAPATLRFANIYIDPVNGNDSWNGTKPFFTTGTTGPRRTLPALTNNFIYAFRDSTLYQTTGGIIVTANGIRFTNYWIGSSITAIDPSNRHRNSTYYLPVISAGSRIINWTTVSGESNKWQATASAGGTVWYDYGDSLMWGRPVGSIVACVLEGDFYQSGSIIYTFCTTDPDTRFRGINYPVGTQTIVNRGDNNLYDHIDIRYAIGGGFQFDIGGEYNTLRDSRIQYTGTYAYLVSGAGGSEGVYFHATGNKLINCFVTEHTHHSVFVYNTGSTLFSDITIDSNLVTNGHYNFFDMNGGPIADIKIRYNIAYEEPWEWYEPITGARNGGFWTNGGVQNVFVAYNLIYDLRDYGNISTVPICDFQVGAITVWNNTFVVSRPGMVNDRIFDDSDIGGSGSSWRNNVFYAAYGVVGATPSGSNNITSPTNFVNFLGSDFSKRNFRLLSNSNCVDAGITGSGLTKDLDGNPIVGLPDVGAFEFQTGGGSVTIPTTLAAISNSNGVITISANETGVDSVRIYGGLTQSPTTWIASITPTGSFNHSSLTGGRIYYYRGKNKVGANFSDYGSQVSDTAKVTISTPTATVTAGINKVTITLNQSSVDSVRVYRGLSTVPTTWVRSLAPVTTFIDTPLTAGTTYYYRFKNLVWSALSSYSTTYSAAVTGPPGVPTTLSLTPGVQKISASVNETAADSVRLYRGPDATTMTWYYTIPKTSTKVDSPLVAGTTYFYRARNIIAGVLSDFSAALSAVPQAPGGGDSGGLKVFNAETGNTTDWPFSTIDTSSTWTAETEAKQNGNYGYKIWFGYGGGSDERYYTFANQTEVYYRFYYYIPTGFTGYTVASRTYFGGLQYNATGGVIEGLFPFTNASGAIYGFRFDSSIPAIARVENTTNTSWWSTNTWHRIEFHFKKGTGADGEVQVWVDGTLAVNDTGNDLTTWNATTVSIGVLSSFGPGFGNRKYIYVDDVKISTLPIGAYPSTD